MNSVAGGIGEANAGELGNIVDHVKEFMKGAAELSFELGRGCRDIVRQTLGNENSFLVKYFGIDSFPVRKLRGPCRKARDRLKCFDEFMPEDKDPVHVFSVLSFVFIAVAALCVNTDIKESVPPSKKVSIHPPSAARILLPDGRYLAYREQGVPMGKARFTIMFLHPFLSSRLSGMPGLKDSLLEEFGIRLLTYDLPGFGESDPHPGRDLRTSALDISLLADALKVKDKFWIVGYSSGSVHAWAALRYIPDRIAGAAIFSPMVNPYDPLLSKEEKSRTWDIWTRKRKIMFFLARRFPQFLSLLYRRSFLSGKHSQIDKWLSLSLGNRDRALIEDPVYEDFWQRDVEESIRQGNAKPFVEEAVLQVSDWGFSLVDLRLQKRPRGRGIVNWLKWLRTLLVDTPEEYTGFLGPIHIWQGMDDRVVPPAMTDFVHRILPGAAVHKLPYQGHYTYLYFCDECHRQVFMTLFGSPQGPLAGAIAVEEGLDAMDEIEIVPEAKEAQEESDS